MNQNHSAKQPCDLVVPGKVRGVSNKKLGKLKLVDGTEKPVSRPDGKRALLLPLAFTLGLAGLALLPPVRQNPRVLITFLGAAAALSAWNAILFVWARRSGRMLTVDVVLRKQHYLQACAQGSVLLYWGWYWPQVYASAYLIVAQLIFAYAFDMLLCWSRRNTYTLGFAPFPIIFSINLFLWFKPDWFYFQFAMVVLGLAAKELIRWNREGRSVHIFNPSSFPLAVFSLILIATHASDLTWGKNIASTQFYPPHMYLMLFLISLPGQFFFGVTSMTMSAVVSMYLFGRIYFAVTGVYFFYDSYIPIAVFLGMHLLFNDPSTSPRTELGRIIYGALYGLSTVALYGLLGKAGNADILRQASPGTTLEPFGQGHRSRRTVAVAPWFRSRGARAIAPALPAQPGVYVYLGARVCGDEHHPSRRRQPSRPVAAVLEAGLQGWPSIRLPLPCRFEFELLQSAIRLGLQRSRPPSYCAFPVGRRSSQARSRGCRGTSQPRLQARICCCLPEPHHVDQRSRPVYQRATCSQGLSDYLEGKQGRDPRTGAIRAVRTGLP